jgi:hypothetical protein
LTFAGGNPGIIRAEIFNLQEQKEGRSSILSSLENSLPDLLYRRAELITNLNTVFAQTKDESLPDVIRASLIERTSFIKNEIANIQYQIDSTQERIRNLKSSEYSIETLINSKKKTLNNITGNIVAKRQSEGFLQTNKELGRIKG